MSEVAEILTQLAAENGRDVDTIKLQVESNTPKLGGLPHEIIDGWRSLPIEARLVALLWSLREDELRNVAIEYAEMVDRYYAEN